MYVCFVVICSHSPCPKILIHWLLDSSHEWLASIAHSFKQNQFEIFTYFFFSSPVIQIWLGLLMTYKYSHFLVMSSSHNWLAWMEVHYLLLVPKHVRFIEHNMNFNCLLFSLKTGLQLQMWIQQSTAILLRSTNAMTVECASSWIASFSLNYWKRRMLNHYCLLMGLN